MHLIPRPRVRSSRSAASTARSVRRVARLTAVLLSLGLGVLSVAPAQAANPVTPGNFTGYGFDQCTAPTQTSMDRWWTDSPFTAVGIYISGDSRGCVKQPNLSATWVARQLARGWRLLPITLGPQAWCTTRDRYLHQVRISPSTTSTYATARSQGAAEARKTMAVAKSLGIPAGSTLWYDIEAFNTKASTACTQSAMYFLSAWTTTLHSSKYVSGIYSSAASGIKMIDDARVTPGTPFTMPDQVWIADWNGKANPSSAYVRSTGWTPHRRIHQYQGGHNEKFGGVTINIDRNWLDLGTGSSAPREPAHCGGVRIDYTSYTAVAANRGSALAKKAMQCLLRERGIYKGAVNGVWNAATTSAANAFQRSVRHPVSKTFWVTDWVSLLSAGSSRTVLKFGSASLDVRRAQRTLNAARHAMLPVSGVFNGPTQSWTNAYANRLKLPKNGLVGATTWAAMVAGRL